jgi:hypothetical protein
MNITNDKEVMIFRSEYEGKAFYSIGLSKKNQDGSFTNGYMPCQFKNGVNLANQTKIKIGKAWLSFYLKDKKTVPYVFISEFSQGTGQKEAPKSNDEEMNVYKHFGSTIKADEIDDDTLPF